MPSDVSWCEAVLKVGAWGWVSDVGCGAVSSQCWGIVLCMCFISGFGGVVFVGRRWRRASSLIASDFLTVESLCRRCSRCVISGCGSLR